LRSIERLPHTHDKYLVELERCSKNCHEEECDHEGYLTLTAKISFDKGDVRLKVISDLSSQTKHVQEDDLVNFSVQNLPQIHGTHDAKLLMTINPF